MPTTETRPQVAKGATEAGAALAKGATEPKVSGKRRYRESNSDFFASGGESPQTAPAAGKPIRECRRQHHIATITTATVWRRWGAPPLAMLFADCGASRLRRFQPPPYAQPRFVRLLSSAAEIAATITFKSRTWPRCRPGAATWPR